MMNRKYRQDSMSCLFRKEAGRKLTAVGFCAKISTTVEQSRKGADYGAVGTTIHCRPSGVDTQSF